MISTNGNPVTKLLADEEMTQSWNVPRVVPGIKPSRKPRRYQERNGATYGRSPMQCIEFLLPTLNNLPKFSCKYRTCFYSQIL